MEATDQLLEGELQRLEANMEQMLRNYAHLQQAYRKLQQDHRYLQSENKELKLQMKNFQNTAKRANIVDVLQMDGRGTQALKERLALALKELDQCIAHLDG